MAKLHFSLVAPERELFSGDVDLVQAPGTEGDFGVLAGHAPFMTTLREGKVTVKGGVFVSGPPLRRAASEKITLVA
jgi:F-type H+-transporting ATPase subunit epsilon